MNEYWVTKQDARDYAFPPPPTPPKGEGWRLAAAIPGGAHGTMVFYWERPKPPTMRPCVECDGTGTAHMGNGGLEACPCCEGDGEVPA